MTSKNTFAASSASRRLSSPLRSSASRRKSLPCTTCHNIIESFWKIRMGRPSARKSGRHFRALIRQWLEEGLFVLEWGNDYWLDSTGKVVAS